MSCGHGTYQCTPPIASQGPGGVVQLLVCMWCATCGAITVRLPQIDPGDEKVAALRSGPQHIPVRPGR